MLAHMQGMILHGHPSMHPSTHHPSIIYHLSVAIPVLWWLNSLLLQALFLRMVLEVFSCSNPKKNNQNIKSYSNSWKMFLSFLDAIDPRFSCTRHCGHSGSNAATEGAASQRLGPPELPHVDWLAMTSYDVSHLIVNMMIFPRNFRNLERGNGGAQWKQQARKTTMATEWP